MEKGMATRSSILAWRIPWTEKPDRLLSVGVKNSWTWLKRLSRQTGRFLSSPKVRAPASFCARQFDNLGTVEQAKGHEGSSLLLLRQETWGYWVILTERQIRTLGCCRKLKSFLTLMKGWCVFSKISSSASHIWNLALCLRYCVHLNIRLTKMTKILQVTLPQMGY